MENSNTKGHIYKRENRDMDIFSLNCLFLLVISIIAGVLYLLFTTDIGAYMLELLAGFRQLPVALVVLVFAASGFSVLIGLKSKIYRDMFLVNVVFLCILLICYMYYQMVTGDGVINSELPYLLHFGINFRVDPLTFMMLSGASFLWLMSIIYGHHYIKIEEKSGGRFFFWMLTALGGVFGALMASDLLTLFLFFEIMYFSCYFLVSHNQSEPALKAGVRYLYMGIVGGLCLLTGIVVFTVNTGSFSIITIHDHMPALWVTKQPAVTAATVFILVGIGIKAAVFPFHIWLPDAHSSAPTPASAILSGMAIKVYIFSLIKILYGVLGADISRAMGLFRLLPPLAVLGMIMGSVFAIGNRDVKKILAYSTVAQVGYMVLGIGMGTRLGMAAALFHITSHVLMKAALFLSAGAILLQKGTRDVKDFQGLCYEMPVTMTVFTLGGMAMIGVPGLNGFMSKWYLAIAALDIGKPVYVVMILVSSFLNAMYYLPIMNAAFLSQQKARPKVPAMDALPKTMLVPLIILAGGMVFFGFFPQLLMDFINHGIRMLY